MTIIGKDHAYSWAAEVRDLRVKLNLGKDVTDKTAKYAWLIRTLNTSDKRIVMKFKLRKSQAKL